jgi:uncharacterized RDD family membrane protein YckC
MQQQDYAGFWIRTAARLIDTILMLFIRGPILTLIYGSGYWTSINTEPRLWDMFLNYVAPAVAILTFWVYKSATPGKMLFKLKIVDAESGGPPGTGQLIGRYLGYYVSTIPLMMGIIWVAFDERKQGWHDKLAKTLVIRVGEEGAHLD